MAFGDSGALERFGSYPVDGIGAEFVREVDPLAGRELGIRRRLLRTASEKAKDDNDQGQFRKHTHLLRIRNLYNFSGDESRESRTSVLLFILRKLPRPFWKGSFMEVFFIACDTKFTTPLLIDVRALELRAYFRAVSGEKSVVGYL